MVIAGGEQAPAPAIAPAPAGTAAPATSPGGVIDSSESAEPLLTPVPEVAAAALAGSGFCGIGGNNCVAQLAAA